MRVSCTTSWPARMAARPNTSSWRSSKSTRSAWVRIASCRRRLAPPGAGGAGPGGLGVGAPGGAAGFGAGTTPQAGTLGGGSSSSGPPDPTTPFVVGSLGGGGGGGGSRPGDGGMTGGNQVADPAGRCESLRGLRGYRRAQSRSQAATVGRVSHAAGDHAVRHGSAQVERSAGLLRRVAAADRSQAVEPARARAGAGRAGDGRSQAERAERTLVSGARPVRGRNPSAEDSARRTAAARRPRPVATCSAARSSWGRMTARSRSRASSTSITRPIPRRWAPAPRPEMCRPGQECCRRRSSPSGRRVVRPQWERPRPLTSRRPRRRRPRQRRPTPRRRRPTGPRHSSSRRRPETRAARRRRPKKRPSRPKSQCPSQRRHPPRRQEDIVAEEI